MKGQTADGATELLPLPPGGRRFTGRRRARLGHASASGHLRLDAMAEYLQDVASDDSRDARLDDRLAWVVRRLLIEVRVCPLVEEELELTTFCTGYGGRWAERRTSIVGADGGLVETVALWVQVDTETGRPKRLGEDFFEHYGEAAQGRKVRARLQHPGPPEDCDRRWWTTRAADIDIIGHINNAVYAEPLEEVVETFAPDRRCRVEVEYGGGVDLGDDVEVLEAHDVGEIRQWFTVNGDVRASSLLRSIEG